MIISSKYNKHENQSSYGFVHSEQIVTTLEAKLRFKSETAPVNRDNLKHRMYDTDDRNDNLNNYLKVAEEIRFSESAGKYLDEYKGISDNAKRHLKIKKRKFKLGIDIKVVANGNYSKKELLDLERLNDFILTGKYPEKLSGPKP